MTAAPLGLPASRGRIVLDDESVLEGSVEWSEGRDDVVQGRGQGRWGSKLARAPWRCSRVEGYLEGSPVQATAGDAAIQRAEDCVEDSGRQPTARRRHRELVGVERFA